MEAFNLSCLYPEIILLFSMGLIVILSLYCPKRLAWVNDLVAQITLITVAFLSFNAIFAKPDHLWHAMFVSDSLSSFLKGFMALLGSLVFFYAKKTLILRSYFRSQYFILCLFSILGMMILVSSAHFLTLYLGVELMVLPVYALMSLDKKIHSTEASIKYFLLGVLSSAFLLYGISLIYGITGDLYIQPVLAFFNSDPTRNVALIAALVFILLGVSFKLGVVPFHLWLPDIYEGSANPVTLFIATLPKIATMAFAIRLFADLFPAIPHVSTILATLGLLSLLLGHLGAMIQSNLKRMLAYSAIAQMGFVVLALFLGVNRGFELALYYLVVYVLSVLPFLGLLTLRGDTGGADSLRSLEGLVHTHPWLSCVMLMVLLSLIGIPPFAGFYAKLFILEALVDQGHLVIATLALLLTVLGAFYYLNIIKGMFFSMSSEGQAPDLGLRVLSFPNMALLSVNGLLLLWLGIFTAPLLMLCTGLMAARLN